MTFDPDKLQFIDDLSLVDFEQLCELLRTAPWAVDRTNEDIRRAIENTPFYFVAVYNNRTIGFIRWFSDTVYRGLIMDFIVSDEFRGLRVGTSMLENFKQHPSVADTERVLALTHRAAAFYLKNEFKSATETTIVWTPSDLPQELFLDD